MATLTAISSVPINAGVYVLTSSTIYLRANESTGSKLRLSGANLPPNWTVYANTGTPTQPVFVKVTSSWLTSNIIYVGLSSGTYASNVVNVSEFFVITNAPVTAVAMNALQFIANDPVNGMFGDYTSSSSSGVFMNFSISTITHNIYFAHVSGEVSVFNARSETMAVDENIPVTNIVTSIVPVATDASAISSLTLDQTYGDYAAFNLDASGNLRFNSSPDYETKNSYAIKFKATSSSGLTGTSPILYIKINDLAEGTDLYFKQNGSFVQAKEVHIKQNYAFVKAKAIYTKQNGSWVQV